MADVKKAKVMFNITSPVKLDCVYVCGNLTELGEWDAKKAIKAVYDAENECYSVSKMLPLGQEVSYKVLATKEWANVEAAEWGCDVDNHYFVVEKGHVETVYVACFK